MDRFGRACWVLGFWGWWFGGVLVRGVAVWRFRVWFIERLCLGFRGFGGLGASQVVGHPVFSRSTLAWTSSTSPRLGFGGFGSRVCAAATSDVSESAYNIACSDRSIGAPRAIQSRPLSCHGFTGGSLWMRTSGRTGPSTGGRVGRRGRMTTGRITKAGGMVTRMKTGIHGARTSRHSNPAAVLDS